METGREEGASPASFSRSDLGQNLLTEGWGSKESRSLSYGVSASWLFWTLFVVPSDWRAHNGETGETWAACVGSRVVTPGQTEDGSLAVLTCCVTPGKAVALSGPLVEARGSWGLPSQGHEQSLPGP